MSRTNHLLKDLSLLPDGSNSLKNEKKERRSARVTPADKYATRIEDRISHNRPIRGEGCARSV